MLDLKEFVLAVNKEILEASKQTRTYTSGYIDGLIQAKMIAERLCRISTEEK